MKKLLKLLFVLSGTTALPLSVVACGQESLDTILNIIRKGEIKYSINELISNKEIEPFQKRYHLSEEQGKELSKTIFHKILEKAKNETEIIWNDDKNIEPENTAYSFKITNSTKEDDETDDYNWTVDKTTGTITVKINYFVGTITTDKQFDARQKIETVFEIKTCETDSDNIVEDWVNKFNDQIADSILTVELLKKEIKMPAVGKNWNDLTDEIQKETNNVIAEQLTNKGFNNSVTSKVENDSSETISKDFKLKIYLSATKSNTKRTTNTFTIWFK